tara:strand:- start:201 stop:1139 length:939 start_codon:yes stop_codon:yes gene_type:complete
MTNQVNLGLVWAETGGTTAVTPAKYAGGWIAEIPTYQNFNYSMQGIDQNILHLAESNSFDWQDDINYEAGVEVRVGNKILTCIVGNINVDPSTDTSNSYWVQGRMFGGDVTTLSKTDGVVVEFNARSLSAWEGQDFTAENTIPLIALKTTGATTNWAVANAAGEIAVTNLGTGAVDGRDIRLDQGNTHRIFHEAHLPLVTEVPGAVGEAPTDTKLYARQGTSTTAGNWIEVTTTTISETPPNPVLGSGKGWYNLVDATLYIDIDDGDSSQWAIAVPPQIPTINASQIPFDPTGTTLTSTNVQDALVEIFNLT